MSDQPFSPDLVRAIDRWSKYTLSTNQHSPEIIALAAFFAGRNLLVHKPSSLVSPLGHVVHYSPKNVDTTFAYVLLMSMLCGNTNTVRLTTNDSIRQRQLALINEIQEVTKLQVNVAHSGDNVIVNSELANACDLRVIWGGDTSISEIRKASLRPWAREITFHDRRSLAIIDTSMFLAQRDVASKLLNDILWMDQASCTSVRGVIWVGADSNFELTVPLLQKSSQSFAIDRFIQLQSVLIKGHRVIGSYDSLLNVECTADQFEGCVKESTTPGVVFHVKCDDPIKLLRIANRSLQTIVTVLDAPTRETLIKQVTSERLCDRVVEPGKSMEFDWVWDGYDLISHLTHRIG